MRPVWILALSLWGMFALSRLVLLIVYTAVRRGEPAGEIARCFLLGARFDAIPIGYVLLPLAVVLPLVPARTFSKRWFTRTLAAYAAAVVMVVGIIESIGGAFFVQFGKRLNWISIDYLKNWREVGGYIWHNYPVLLLGICGVGVFYLGYRLLARAFGNRGAGEWRPWQGTVATVVLIGLCVLACRASVGRHVLRKGRAYFSDQNRLINYLTLNNFYTLFGAFKSRALDGKDEGGLHPFPSTEEALRVAGELLTQPADTPAGDAVNPLWRRTDTRKPMRDYNVVVVLMEGMAGKYVGALGYRDSQTPNLDELCRQGLYFERMYAVGARTSRAIVGVLCGHPDVLKTPIIRLDKAQGTFLMLPGVFRRRGYRTMFIYGGRPDFDNMNRFLTTGGVETIIGQQDLGPRDEAGTWGFPDEVIFRAAHEQFRSMGDQKFFAVVLTVSNHQPYEVPAGRVELVDGETLDEKRTNGYRYADWALGEYFRYAREAPYFRNTVFVLVADHGQEINHRPLFDVPGYRVPCLFYAPGIIEPRRVATVASQTDIAPTLLAMLGGSYEHCFFGRNVLAVKSGDGFALLHEDDHLAWVRNRLALVQRPQQPGALFETDGFSMKRIEPSTCRGRTATMRRNLLSLYKAARHLYREQAYRAPSAARRGTALE